MRTRVPTAKLAQLQAEIDSLKAILADSERRVRRLEEERRHLIPVEEMHAALDQFNLPRRDPRGGKLVISQRFAILKVRMETER